MSMKNHNLLVKPSLRIRSRTDDWLEALNHAVNNQFLNGILSRDKDMFLISDSGLPPP